MMHPASTIDLMLLSTGLALFAISSLQDWALRLVPNSIPVAIALIGLMLRIRGGNAMGALIGGSIVFVSAALCWRRGWLGGADVKLFTAGAVLVPPVSTADFVLASCLAGGVLAVAYSLLARMVPPPASRRPTTLWRRYCRLEQRRLQRHGPLPYATAIAAGATFILLRG